MAQRFFQKTFEIPAGEIAAVITHLEMTEAPRGLAPRPAPAGVELIRVDEPTLSWYRQILAAIGRQWLWYVRLILSDEALAAILGNDRVAVFAVAAEGGDVGLLELDFRKEGEAEIAFFGLVPERTGQGLGRWLMGEALRLCWAEPGIKRVWLHTCTTDSPVALPFYLGVGFRAFRREVEVFSDPRLAGIHPLDAAPHIPIVRPANFGANALENRAK